MELTIWLNIGLLLVYLGICVPLVIFLTRYFEFRRTNGLLWRVRKMSLMFVAASLIQKVNLLVFIGEVLLRQLNIINFTSPQVLIFNYILWFSSALFFLYSVWYSSREIKSIEEYTKK